MQIFLSILLVLLLLVSCKNKDEEVNPGLKSINFGFETSLEDWAKSGGSGERYFDEDISISSEIAHKGMSSCKFRITPESYIARGNRAELTFDQEAVEGDESWYEWSFYIPGTYKDVPLEDNTGAPNWQVMGQWHQQPNFEEGESWDNYSQKGKSVPIAFNYLYLSDNDPEYLKLKKDPRLKTLFGYDSIWNNVSAISLSVGDPPVAVTIKKIEKNTWYRVKIHIKWSQDDNGFVEAWLNEEPFTDGKYYGKNMLNKVSHYFKYGLYRNPSIPYTNEVYDDIKIY